MNDMDVIGSNGRGTMHRAPTIGTAVTINPAVDYVDDGAPRTEKFGKPAQDKF